MRKTLVLFAFVFAAVALAGCGGSSGSSGSGSGSIPETASFAPASSAYYVSFDTDVNGDQWHKASVLLNRFPSSDQLVKSLEGSMSQDGVNFEQDVKPALGPEVGLVGLGVDTSSFVLFTKSPEPAKLEALLKKGSNPAVTREIDGWVVAADKAAVLDRFEQARSAGTLADSSAFKDGVAGVQTDGIALAYVPGTTLTTGLAKVAKGQAAAAGQLTKSIGKLNSLAASASAEDQGVRFDLTASTEGAPSASTFEPSLADTMPAKPLLFVTAAHLDTTLRQALDSVQQQNPSFAQQRAQIEQALGLSLDTDVLPLFKGEIAVGVYGDASGASLPVTIDVVLKVDDEAKATKLMDRLGALLELGGSGKTSTVQVGGLQATVLTFTGQDVSLLWAVTDGKLLISTSRAGLEKLNGTSARLAGDPAYTDALGAADVPAKVTFLLYSDLQAAVPFISSASGGSVDAGTQANLKPLRSLVASATQDGSTYDISGFIGIG